MLLRRSAISLIISSSEFQPLSSAKRAFISFNASKLLRTFLLSLSEPELVRERIFSAGKVTGTNLVILMMAIMVASIGLIKNSTAAIIGAMLISPLMGSLYLIAYGVVTLDRDVLRRALSGFAMQILISIGTSTVFFLISPLKTVTTELLARTSPDFFDVLLAIFGGLAGIIGFTRLPGLFLLSRTCRSPFISMPAQTA